MGKGAVLEAWIRFERQGGFREFYKGGIRHSLDGMDRICRDTILC